MIFTKPKNGLVYNSSLFRIKLVYSNVIGIADSKSERNFCDYGIFTEIFAFYHLQPERHDNVHLVSNNACPNSAQL